MSSKKMTFKGWVFIVCAIIVITCAVMRVFFTPFAKEIMILYACFAVLFLSNAFVKK